MRYSEKENYLRVINWDGPSHVCYPAPVQTVSYFGAWPNDSRPSEECLKWQDIWGVFWEDYDGEVFPTEAAITPDKIADLQLPDPHSEQIRTDLKQKVEQIDRDGKFLQVNHPYFLYENGFNILGPVEFLLTLVADEDGANLLLDKLIDFEIGVAEEYVRFKPDQIHTSDDYGMQDRLAVSPEMWRQFFKPRLQKIYDFYRSELGDDVVICHHSCGHVMPILEDFIELGVKILNPLQTTANDLQEAADIVDHKLVIAGAVDGQQILPFGSPDEVKKEVFEKLDLLWKDGGFLPFPEKFLGVPTENLAAMEMAIREWSKINVEE